MKTLALMRHGKSSWADPDLRDFDRPLNQRGRSAAAAMGKAMRDRRLAVDLILASPARRVVETIEHFEEGYARSLPTRWEDDLYAGCGRSLLKIVRTAKLEGLTGLLVVGHDPALQDFALDITAPHYPDFARRVADHFPTAALAVFRIPLKRWAELRSGTAVPELYLRPRDLQEAARCCG